MIKEFLSEFCRNIAEMKKYKFNIIFANLQIFIISYIFTKYFFADDKEVVFFMLIVWYFSTHGLSNPTYILEEEIFDRTILNIVQSKTGILKVMILRCLNTLLVDIIKAIPIFTFLYFFANFNNSIVYNLHIKLMVIFLAIIDSYILGIFFSTFVLFFKRFSGFISLTYYYILFFGGIFRTIDDGYIFYINKFLFPYINARIIFENLAKNSDFYIGIFILLIQLVVFSLISFLFFSKCLNKSIKNGDLYGI
ncbi:antibiotic ABC transporter permease [Parvimonas parva]|uniref:Antibiotic ABC transporter permease n=1 Tax=Parvimonas parva TaxID=2769485 RepID=A0ABS1C7T7_9FIRM|nr:antibiotic ABC transporter permease [Parvimonas parva]MBK1468018.1 antibiotic ABC transporter permease [Parvimonas parva]